MNNLVAGIDPSTKEVVYRDAITANPDDAMFLRIRNLTLSLYRRFDMFCGVCTVIMEKPASKLNFKTLYALSVLNGAILTVFLIKRPEITIRFVAASTAKKRITGSGRATKEDVIKAVKERFGIVEPNNNIADAIAIGLCGVIE